MSGQDKTDITLDELVAKAEELGVDIPEELKPDVAQHESDKARAATVAFMGMNEALAPGALDALMEKAVKSHKRDRDYKPIVIQDDLMEAANKKRERKALRMTNTLPEAVGDKQELVLVGKTEEGSSVYSNKEEASTT